MRPTTRAVLVGLAISWPAAMPAAASKRLYFNWYDEGPLSIPSGLTAGK
jgi:hypothetical protein